MENVFITPAKIHFYENIYKSIESGQWFFTIKFEEAPMFIPHNRIRITLTTSAHESTELANILRHHFAINHIFEGSKVSVIYTESDILAIGVNGKNNYLDARDGFRAKPFFELGINATSLIIKL